MSANYAARVLEVAGEGVRLDPAADAVVPEQQTEVNLLGLSIALALGAAGYEHHPEPRDVEGQTVEALLAGEARMPWRAGRKVCAAGTEPYVVCERTESGHFVCRVDCLPGDE
jgi:hypothetical protein